MAGSGTCAIDACMGSSMMSGEKIIIGNNGFFGDRLAAVADSYGLQVVEVKAPWGEALDPAEISKAIESKSGRESGGSSTQRDVHNHPESDRSHRRCRQGY